MQSNTARERFGILTTQLTTEFEALLTENEDMRRNSLPAVLLDNVKFSPNAQWRENTKLSTGQSEPLPSFPPCPPGLIRDGLLSIPALSIPPQPPEQVSVRGSKLTELPALTGIPAGIPAVRHLNGHGELHFEDMHAASTEPMDRYPSAKQQEKATKFAADRPSTSSEEGAAGSRQEAHDIAAWEAQFERIDKESIGFLSPDVCYEVLSQNIAGAELPAFKVVAAAMSHLTQTLGAATDSYSLSSNCKDYDSSMMLASYVGLDFLTFRHFMAGHDSQHPHKNPEVNSAINTLRLAFTHEEKQYLFHETHQAMKGRDKLVSKRKASGGLGILLEMGPAIVIVVNATVMGLQSDFLPGHAVWQVFEVVFLVCYVTESVLKLIVYGCADYFCGVDKFWNYFDLLCIVLSGTDLAISLFVAGTFADVVLIKLVRLVRIFRLVRALQYPAFAELKEIVVGVAAGMRVLGWAIVSLLFVVFFLGTALNKLMTETEELTSVRSAMFTVFRCVTEGCTTYEGFPLQVKLTKRYGDWFMVVYALVFMVVTFGLFNLIMATFIDQVARNSFARKQRDIGSNSDDVRNRMKRTFGRLMLNEDPGLAATGRATIAKAGMTIVGKLSPLAGSRLATSFIDKGGASAADPRALDGVSVSREVFHEWLHDPEIIDMLESADIDLSNKFDLFDVLDVDMGGELEFSELIAGLMRLRGPITKSDIVAMRLKLRYATKLVDTIHIELTGGRLSTSCHDYG